MSIMDSKDIKSSIVHAKIYGNAKCHGAATQSGQFFSNTVIKSIWTFRNQTKYQRQATKKKMLNRMIKTRVIAISNGFNAHSMRMNARPMCFMLLFKYHILYDGPWQTALDTYQSKPCSVCKRWCEFSVKCIHAKKTQQLIDIEWFLNHFATRNEHHLMCWIIKDVFDTILTPSVVWLLIKWTPQKTTLTVMLVLIALKFKKKVSTWNCFSVSFVNLKR